MDKKRIRTLMVGAHPDDCVYLTGGIAGKYRVQGHVVKSVSVTNGDTGRYSLSVGQLATIRAGETRHGKADCVPVSPDISNMIHCRLQMMKIS